MVNRVVPNRFMNIPIDMRTVHIWKMINSQKQTPLTCASIFLCHPQFVFTSFEYTIQYGNNTHFHGFKMRTFFRTHRKTAKVSILEEFVLAFIWCTGSYPIFCPDAIDVPSKFETIKFRLRFWWIEKKRDFVVVVGEFSSVTSIFKYVLCLFRRLFPVEETFEYFIK